MKEEDLINLLDGVRHNLNPIKLLKENLIKSLCVVDCPDLTDVWNLACFLSNKNQITIYEMNNVWIALSEMVKEDKCSLSEINDSGE